MLKRGLDHETALKYKEAISRTGALCFIEKEDVPAPPATPQSGQTAPIRSRQEEASGRAPEPTASFACPRCGHAQEKEQCCAACGVYFAKVAKQAEREFQDFRKYIEPQGRPKSWLATRFASRRAQLAAVASLMVLSFGGYFMVGFAEDVISQTSVHAQQANSALKRNYDKGTPDLTEMRRLLSARDFVGIEALYNGYLNQYRKDVTYEVLLQQAYNLFSPENGVSAEDLDLWVATTGSYTAYAARGAYKAQRGFLARGTRYISETPQSNLEAMQRLHDEAAKDLETALAANPYLVPAYCFLIKMAKSSDMPFSAKGILEKAEGMDKRAYFVRFEYMTSLEPRWGGSYGEMSEYAKNATRYADQNPRLWCLLGAVESDRADDQYRAGNYSAAIRSYTKALKYGDRVSLLNYRAGCYFELGKKAEAAADYRKVLYYDPTDSKARAGVDGG